MLTSPSNSGNAFRAALRLGTIYIVMALSVMPLHAQTDEATGSGAEADASPGAESSEAAAGPSGFERFAARQKGLRALADGIYDSAARFFQEYRTAVGTREPDLTDATMLLVETQLRAGRPADAQKALNIYSRLSAGVDDPYYREGILYWRSAVHLALDQPEAAAEIAQRVVESAETPHWKAKALLVLGDAHATLAHWEAAQEAFSRFLDNYPQDPDVLHARMALLEGFIANREYERAQAILDDIAEQHGETIDTRVTLYRVTLYALTGNVSESVRLYRTIESQRPEKPDPDWWLTASTLLNKLVEKEQYNDALDIVSQALVLAPTAPDRKQLRLQQADMLLKLDRFEPAIQALEQFKNDYPDASEVIPVEFRLAQLLREEKKLTAAANYFGNVAEAERASPSMRYQAALRRAWCFMDAEHYDDATQAFSKAAKLGTSNEEVATAYFLAAEAAYRVGNYTNAAMLYQTVADEYSGTSYAEKARFRQAESRAQANLYSDAALVFKQFLEEYPESDERDEALLQRGIALKNSGSFEDAVDLLSTFATEYPDNPKVPRALMEAFAAAKATGNVETTLTFLTRLIDNYPESDLIPYALYQRIHVHFLHGHFAAALTDSDRFLKDYARLPTAADVMLWLGDYYANVGNHVTAEQNYMKVVSSHPDLPQAQTALFEAAMSAYSREDYSRVELLLTQLTKQYSENAVTNVHARAEMLYGDTLSQQSQYRSALEHFQKAEELAKEGRLFDAAKGRAGDMLYSLAATDGQTEEERVKLLKQAEETFAELVSGDDVAADLREIAQYRLAKTLEKQGNIDAATDAYLSIVYEYDIDLGNGKVRDWYYFARSGYDAARLLVMAEDYEDAARVYERLAEAGIPTAKDALEKARQIRQRTSK
ncbi:MAG: tetratricopeptide repeat protein [Candidatus Pacebacteria bacterium]|nr:tetratricopeptide repeat protein [Candidatus Paceibacterota bacterium]